jgi:FolB domain-containing protein
VPLPAQTIHILPQLDCVLFFRIDSLFFLEPFSASKMDKVILKNMPFDLAIGLDQWRRFHKPQPVLITIEAQPVTTLEPAAAKDDVNLSLDYGKMYKRIASVLGDADPDTFPTVRAVISRLVDLIPDCGVIDIEILLPKALPQSLGGVLYRYQVDKSEIEADTSSLALTIKQIGCNCIVGVNPHERLYKQTVFVDISVPVVDPAVGVTAPEDHYTAALHDMVHTVWERVEGSTYHTIEALATAVAQIVTVNYGHTVAKVRVDKPSAITTIEAAGVEITRSKTFFENKDFWKVKLP